MSILATCLVFGCLLVIGCNLLTKTTIPLRTTAPTGTPEFQELILLSPMVINTAAARPVPLTSAEEAVTPTPVIPDTGWRLIRPGMERRVINLFEKRERVELLYLLRLEPDQYRFGLAYQPRTPLTLETWQDKTDALLLVNGGYYREEGGRLIPNGLIVVDGQPLGQSFGNFAGMLAVTDLGPELRWLAQRPVDPNEPLRAAVQSFPLLVKPGGELGFPAEREDHHQARRTVIGQDTQGRILFIMAVQGNFTLHQLSVYLTNSDLDLDIALNLDGGKSSGLLLTEPPEFIPAFAPLPVVITVHEQ